MQRIKIFIFCICILAHSLLILTIISTSAKYHYYNLIYTDSAFNLKLDKKYVFKVSFRGRDRDNSVMADPRTCVSDAFILRFDPKFFKETLASKMAYKNRPLF